MTAKRQDRLAHLLRDEISNLLQRQEIKDPRLGFVTIPGVRLSKDLSHASVFVSVYGSSHEADQSLRALQNAGGFLRRQLAQRLQLRQIPELSFQLDDSIAEGLRMSQLLKDVQAADESASSVEAPAETPLPEPSR